MKINKWKLISPITYFSMLFLLIISPFALYGCMVIYDNFSTHTNARENVQQYVETSYPNQVVIKDVSFDTYSSEYLKDTLIMTVDLLEDGQTYAIYYDLETDIIFYDELEMFKGIQINTPKDFSTNKSPKQKALNEYSTSLKLIHLYEKQLNRMSLSSQQRSGIEEKLEEQYIKNGLLEVEINQM